jgi:cytidylate kinase
MNYAIAIDGPAAAGKSTVAKLLAKKLNITYIDTGAMYRAFTYYVLSKNFDPKDEAVCSQLIDEVLIQLMPNNIVLCNGIDVTKAIREQTVTDNVSFIASYKSIRLSLVEMQRKLAKKVSVVMDGRDIGTYVLPEANVKIYQIASIETRAVRRYEENLAKGIACTLDQVEEDLRRRDYIDSHRDFAPLRPAEDSILLDTSFMTVDQAVQKILEIIQKKLGIQS